MYLQLLCALYRFQPPMGLHSELPAAGPWTGHGAVCSGGPRSHCQKWLCGAIHCTIHQPTNRCIEKPMQIINQSLLWHAVCNLLFFSQVIDMFIYWRQVVPVCPPAHSSSMSKSPAKEYQSKLCPSVWPLLKARHDVHLNEMESCIFWQQRALKRGSEREQRKAVSPSPVLKRSNLHWATAGGKMSLIRDEEALWLSENELPQAR